VSGTGALYLAFVDKALPQIKPSIGNVVATFGQTGTEIGTWNGTRIKEQRTPVAPPTPLKAS
jgi:hypothetical protein